MKNISILQNILSKKGVRLTILSLFISIFPSVVSADSASIEQVSATKVSYGLGEAVVLKVMRGTELPATGKVNVDLSSATGGEFSDGNLGGTCTGAFAPGIGNADISSGDARKAFCYRNSNPGLDTITAIFSLGASTSQATFNLLIAKEEGTSTDNLPKTGVLLVHKVVVGESKPDYTQFSFTINDSATTSFASSGVVDLIKEVGAYTITEVPAEGYDVTYENCKAISVNTEATSTCTITNTKKEVPPPEPDTYKIAGYLWHDDNGNALWDKNDEEAEEIIEELPLSGWTVNITNGTTTMSTTTDEFGYYYFPVPAGIWVITENLKENWKLTTVESYTVTVPEEMVEIYSWSLWDYFLPTAYAAIVQTRANDYNFGNDEIPPVITIPNQSGSGNGSGRRKLPKDDPIPIPISIPTPQVLGEQVTIVPIGAPETGAGGASPIIPTITLGHLLYRRELKCRL